MNIEGAQKTVCPFYIREREYKISCEGIQDTDGVSLFFATSEQREKWQETYCFDIYKYKRCPVAQLIFEKYKD